MFALPASAGARPTTAKPTVVLVHGAFADSSGWNSVIDRLRRDGYPVRAARNPAPTTAIARRDGAGPRVRLLVVFQCNSDLAAGVLLLSRASECKRRADPLALFSTS